MDLRLVLPAGAAWLAAFVLVAWPPGRWATAIVLWLCAGAGVAVLLLARRPVAELLSRRPVAETEMPPRAGRIGARSPPRAEGRAATHRTGRAAKRRTAWAVSALCAMAAALVSTSVAASSAGRQPQSVLDLAASGRHLTATVEVTALPALSSGSGFGREIETRLRVRGTMTELRAGTVSGRLAVPVLVFLSAGIGDVRTPRAAGASEGARIPDGLEIGATIRVSGTLSATAPEDDVAFLLFGSGPAMRVAPPGWLHHHTDALRTGFREAATRLPGDGGALLPGLAIGDTTAVPDRLDEAMKISSLSHLTAVSGANCAVVVAAVMMLASGLGAPRGVRVGASLVALVGFVLLVTPQPSVLRAAIMATIVLAALATGRPGRGLPSLALAAIVLLTADPWLCRNYGFLLSVLATAGLLVLAGPLTNVFSRVLPRWLAAALALPTAAQLACQPLLILLAPSIPLYGIPANLLAAPTAPVATMVGLGACLLLPIAPVLGTGAVALAWLPASWIAAVAAFTADLPLSRLPWLDGVPGMASLAGGTALVLAVILRRRGPRWSGLHTAAAVLVVALIGGYAGGLTGTEIRNRVSVPNDWQYAACDVGQGDAVLVRGGDALALVDVGPDPAVLGRCLDRFGVGRIDLLVLTHYDLDHIGGLAAVRGRVDTTLASPPASAADARTLDGLRTTGSRVLLAGRGMTGFLGELGWRVLWPRASPGAPAPDAGGNDSSVVLLFEGDGACDPRCLSSVFLGDLSEPAQVRLAAQAPLPKVDVVKVAHHGSADQSARLYRTLAAPLGLVSVGAENTYGHPADALLHILAASGTSVARTDRSGTIVVSAGERTGELVVWRERSE